MKQEISLPINSYLSEEDRRKKNLAFYGEFFVMKEFDDGWRENLYERFITYCENFENSNLDLEVFDEVENISGDIRLILSTDKIIWNSEKDILEITTKLQKEFLFTPVFQNTNFWFSDDNILPVVLDEPEKDSKRYNRFILQREVKKILVLKSEIKKIDYYLNIILDIDDEILKAQTDWLIELKNKYELEIKDLHNSKATIISNFYSTEVFKPFWTESNNLTDNQSDAVLDLSWKDTRKNWLRILSWMKRMEELHKWNIDLSKQLSDKFEFQTAKIFSDIENLIWSTWLEVQSQNWILTNFDLDGGNNLLKAKIIWVKNSDVYFLNWKLHWLEIDWITASVSEMKVKNHDDEYIYSFEVKLFNWKKILCISDWDKYKVLEIDWIKEFYNFESINYNKWNLSYWYTELENWYKSYFYLENWEYKFLEIDWEKEFKSLRYLKTNNWIPNNSIIELKAWNYSCFIEKNWKYKFLEIDWEKEFIDININWRWEEYFYGDVELENWFKKYFYLEDWECKVLEIGWENEFYSLDNLSIKDWKVWSGKIKLEDWNFKYFYLHNWKYKILEIEWEKEFLSFHRIEDKDWVIMHWRIPVGNWDEMFFYLENNKYKFLRIKWKTSFKSISNLHIKEWRLLLWIIKNTDWENNIFYLDDWKYKILEVEWKSNFIWFYDINIQNGKLISWKIKHKDDKVSFFYLNKNKYIFVGSYLKKKFYNIIVDDSWNDFKIETYHSKNSWNDDDSISYYKKDWKVQSNRNIFGQKIKD